MMRISLVSTGIFFISLSAVAARKWVSDPKEDCFHICMAGTRDDWGSAVSNLTEYSNDWSEYFDEAIRPFNYTAVVRELSEIEQRERRNREKQLCEVLKQSDACGENCDRYKELMKDHKFRTPCQKKAEEYLAEIAKTYKCVEDRKDKIHKHCEKYDLDMKFATFMLTNMPEDEKDASLNTAAQSWNATILKSAEIFCGAAENLTSCVEKEVSKACLSDTVKVENARSQISQFVNQTIEEIKDTLGERGDLFDGCPAILGTVAETTTLAQTIDCFPKCIMETDKWESAVSNATRGDFNYTAVIRELSEMIQSDRRDRENELCEALHKSDACGEKCDQYKDIMKDHEFRSPCEKNAEDYLGEMDKTYDCVKSRQRKIHKHCGKYDRDMKFATFMLRNMPEDEKNMSLNTTAQSWNATISNTAEIFCSAAKALITCEMGEVTKACGSDETVHEVGIGHIKTTVNETIKAIKKIMGERGSFLDEVQATLDDFKIPMPEIETQAQTKGSSVAILHPFAIHFTLLAFLLAALNLS